ncbi:MAG: hypothetical protein KA974_11495 [Saprospiraceae bacterium]|nr:hypothetical protein [Saprospiraceae bacterium]
MNSDNIFFDITKLKACGKNVIIGKTVRIRYPELVEIGDNVIIDDFTYISTQLKIHNHVHIASGSKIIGGKQSFVELCDFSGLSCNSVLVAGSDDFVGGITSPMIPLKYRGNVVIGKIVLNKHCVVATSSVVFPNVIFEEGACLAALSLAKNNLQSYTIYGGVPAKPIKERNKEDILKFEKQFREEQ